MLETLREREREQSILNGTFLSQCFANIFTLAVNEIYWYAEGWCVWIVVWEVEIGGMGWFDFPNLVNE